MAEVQLTIKRGGSIWNGGNRTTMSGSDDEQEDEEYQIDDKILFGSPKDFGHMVLLCGRGRSGKTTAVKHLYRMNKTMRGIGADGSVKTVPLFHDVIVLCDSPAISSYTWVNKANRMRYSHEVVENLLHAQEQSLKKGIKRRVLLILDDIIGGRSWHTGTGKQVFDTLSTRGRHFGILTCILTQHYFGVPPSVRTNSWITLMCNPTDKDTKEFYSQYGTHDSYQECHQWLKQCAKNYVFAYVRTDDLKPRLFKVPEKYAL